MDTLKILSTLPLPAENICLIAVMMRIVYVCFYHFIPHAAENDMKNATPFHMSIYERNKKWAMTCKKLAGPAIELFAGGLFILFSALSAIRTIIELLSR